MVILSIIAALLLPVFARAKEKSKQTACLAQLRQVSSAMQMYRADHDDLGYRSLVKGNRYPWNWLEGLEPYLKNGRLVWCVEPGNWGEPVVDYSFYNWPNLRIDLKGAQYFRSWDAPAGRVVIVCHNHARGNTQEIGGLHEGEFLFAREDTSAGKVDTKRLIRWIFYMDTFKWEKDPKNTKGRPGGYWYQFPNEPGPPRLEE